MYSHGNKNENTGVHSILKSMEIYGKYNDTKNYSTYLLFKISKSWNEIFIFSFSLIFQAYFLIFAPYRNISNFSFVTKSFNLKYAIFLIHFCFSSFSGYITKVSWENNLLDSFLRLCVTFKHNNDWDFFLICNSARKSFIFM